MVAIGDLSTGVSSAGMDEYMSNLKAAYITETEKLINDYSDINNAINEGWQGVAKDKFMESFSTARETIIEDLEKEYKNLEARLTELQAQYFEADANMISDD